MVSVETRLSWVIACAALAVLAVAFGAPLLVVVALKPIAASLGHSREIPALAYSMAWLGMAVGGIAMGRIAERIGVRYTAAFGGGMIAAGMLLASGGAAWQLVLGYGLCVGLLGNAGLNAPLYVYVSRWFDRRRGTALALISSGQYIAGAVWPSVFEHGLQTIGWPQTMRLFAVLELAVVAPIALLVFRAPPEAAMVGGAASVATRARGVLGLHPNLVLVLLALASFCCCVPMAMPQAHLVAFCGDLGIAASQGAAMLSLLLACAFVSRQFWGWLSDRIGGLRTVLVCSACQFAAMGGFLLARSEFALFLVSALFGLGFSGLIPAYVLAIRELFPPAEASWRVPTLLLFSGSGMAAGGWLAGWIFDRTGYYALAFGAGLGFNLMNLVIIGLLVLQSRQARPAAVFEAA